MANSTELQITTGSRCRIRAAATLVIILSLAFNCSAQVRRGDVTPSAEPDSTSSIAPARPCIFDSERGDVSDCLRTSANGALSIAPQYLRDLDFDSQGLAPVRSHENGWMYVNRNGRVLITGVPTYDNGPDAFHNGLVRFIHNSKYGFANQKGQIVIPAIYDGAMHFENGRAAVCNHCESKCVDQACEYHGFEGGESFSIDTQGKRLDRLPVKQSSEK